MQRASVPQGDKATPLYEAELYPLEGKITVVWA